MPIFTDDRDRGHGDTFIRKNLHDNITAQCQAVKNNRDYKNDVDNLYLQLTQLLNDKVSGCQLFWPNIHLTLLELPLKFYCTFFDLANTLTLSVLLFFQFVPIFQLTDTPATDFTALQF